MNFSFYKIALSICLLLCSLLCFAHASGKELEEKDFNYSYFEDTTTVLSLKKLFSSPELFIPMDNQSLNLGFRSYPTWMKIEFSPIPHEHLLVIENAHLDSVIVYMFAGERLLTTYTSGDLTSFENRTLNYNFFNFSIPETTNKILIKTCNKGLVLIPAKILPFRTFFNHYQKYTLIHWFYFGFVILAIASNLLFFFWLRESIYFYYVLCIFAIGFVTAIDFGYTFQFLWPNTPIFNKFNTTFYCSTFFVLLFIAKMLNIKKNFPKLYYLYLFLYGVFFFSVIASLLGFYTITIKIIYSLVFIVPVLALSSGTAKLIKTRSESSKFFLIGWSGYFLSMFVYIAGMENIIPYNIFTANAMQIGSSIEILFLNLAILSTINSLKKEKEQILAEQNRVLEQKVWERTIELHEKTDEVLAQNEELQTQHNELEIQHDKLEQQNKIIEDHNALLIGSKESLERLVEKRTEELKYINEELTEYNNRLEQFAFITAHNLRGPVSTLLGLSQVYNTNDSSDPINQVILEKSKETTIKLDEIIKDLVGILDLQKSVANLSHNININTVLKDVMILLSKELEQSKAIIHHNFKESTTITAVPAYLNNIFYNLISNSLKYCKKDSTPHVEIHYGVQGDTILFKFSDRGRGIDLSKQGEKIFRPYKRFHLDKEGKGLGLYIVKTQVEMMRGKVSIESEEDKGTTITIVLPAR